MAVPMKDSMHSAFVDEATACLARAEGCLRGLDRGLGRADTSAIIEIYRAIHTITGLAGYLELAAVHAIARTAELLVDDLRVHRSHREGSRIDTLLRAVRRMAEMVASMTRGGCCCEGDDREIVAALLAHIPTTTLEPQRARWDFAGPQDQFIHLGTQITTGPPSPISIQAGIYE